MTNDDSRWRDSRILSLAVYVLVLATALFVVVDSIAAMREERREVRLLRERTQMLEARATALVNGQSDPQGQAAVPAGRLIVGQTAGLASAEFQRDLTNLVEQSGALVRSLDIREGEAVSGVAAGDGTELVRLRLEAGVEVMEQTLPDLLYAIETNLPLLIVDSVTVRPNRAAGPGFDGVSDPTADRALNLRLAVSAFWIRDL